MFTGATRLKSVSLPDTSSVTDMANMFNGATSFAQDIRNWNVDNVVNFNAMFNGATAMISKFNTSANWNVTPTAAWFDTTAPTMAITSSEVTDGDTSNDSTLSLTFTSSEATTDFVAGDITVSGGSLVVLRRLHLLFIKQPSHQVELEQQR